MIDVVKFALNMLKRFISVRLLCSFLWLWCNEELYVCFLTSNGFCFRYFAYDTRKAKGNLGYLR